MNEQIVKLSREAENYACTVAEKYVPECGEVSYLWEHSFRKKFAELLAKETICKMSQQMEVHGDNQSNNPAYYKSINDTLKHFGVEQE